MRIASVREFRDHATEMLRTQEPILVLRRGTVAGIFFPQPGKSIPLEMKREMFSLLSAEVGRQLRKRGVSEKALLEDFKAWKRQRREARRRR